MICNPRDWVIERLLQLPECELAADAGKIRPICPSSPRDHVAGPALSFAEKELLTGLRISCRLEVIRRIIERTDPSGQREQLAVGQSERRHSALRAVADQIADLILGATAEHTVVDQRRTTVRPSGRFSVTSRAELRKLLLGGSRARGAKGEQDGCRRRAKIGRQFAESLPLALHGYFWSLETNPGVHQKTSLKAS